MYFFQRIPYIHGTTMLKVKFKLKFFSVVTWYFSFEGSIFEGKRRHPLWKYYALGFVRSYCKEIFKDEHVSFNIYCQHQRSCFLWSLMKNIILPKHNICLFYSPIHIAVIIIKSAYWMVGSMGNDALRVYRVFHSNYHIIHKCSNFKIKLEHLVNMWKLPKLYRFSKLVKIVNWSLIYEIEPEWNTVKCVEDRNLKKVRLYVVKMMSPI